MKRTLVFLYGVVSYTIFFGTFCYAAGFIGNFMVPKSMDSGPVGPLGTALVVNGLLLAVFAVQHSGMARPGFKAWLTRFIPEPAERPTYVLLSSLALIALFWAWQPMGGTIWRIEGTAGQAILYGLFGLGFLAVLVTTFLINHFDLFGLRQAWLYLRGREYTPVRFVEPGPYKVVRHPLYVGWLLAFWATPTMSVSHLVFAIGTTVYILVAIQLEERDLEASLGDDYRTYRDRVPMLIPGKKREQPAPVRVS